MKRFAIGSGSCDATFVWLFREYLALREVVPEPSVLDDIPDRERQLYRVDTAAAGLRSAAVAVDDRLRLVAEL